MGASTSFVIRNKLGALAFLALGIPLFAPYAQAQTTGGNGVAPPRSSAVASTQRLADGSLTLQLHDQSGRPIRFNVPPTPTVSERSLAARSRRSRSGYNWCTRKVEFAGCPTSGANDQGTCDKVQSKLCKFCSSQELDQAKCETWANQRQTCQNACTGFAQTSARPIARRVASCALTETTLPDASINVVQEENGNRRSIWNLPVSNQRPFDGPDWCEMDLQYIDCSDQTTCDRVQSKLCEYCSDDTTYNQSKCARWLRKRRDCVNTCDDQLDEITPSDPYAARETL